MQITKESVMNFVSKVQSKATDSIASKHDPLIREAKIKAIGSNMHYITTAQDAIRVFDDARTQLLQSLDAISISQKERRYRYGKPSYMEILPAKTDFLELILDEFEFNIESVVKLQEVKEAEFKEVNSAYTSLRNQLSAMRSPKKMVEFLEELGFDVTYLKSPSPKIDKDKLFVCGEKS